MRWDAAATVADRRFHSHIMDSNDPYLHLSKFFSSPLPVSSFAFSALWSDFMLRKPRLFHGDPARSGAPSRPSAHFYPPVSRSPAVKLRGEPRSFSRCLFKFAANRKRQVIVVVQVRQGQRLAL